MTERQSTAKDLFSRGHNCAQSVLLSFQEMLDMEEDELHGFASGFGGGMGMLQLTCGSATGAFMVLSLYASEATDDNQAAKDYSAEMIRQFDKKFRTKMGTLSCREILGVDLSTEAGKKEAIEKDLFNTRCVDAVTNAVGIVEEILVG